MKTAPQIAFGSLVFFWAAILLPGSAAAQQLSVSPTSVSVQAPAGTNAPSQTVQVKKRGKPTAQVSWSVVQPNASWVSVTPTGGVNDGTLTLISQRPRCRQGSIRPRLASRARARPSPSTVQATIVSSAPSPLIANCPANMTASSADGNPVPVTYVIPTPSGGTPPYTTSGSPPSGSSFPVGPTTVQVTAQDSSQPPQTATCSFTVTVNYSPPPSTGVGPQSTIQCPAGAENIFPTDSVAYIQNLISIKPGTTTFCFRAGTYHVDASIRPKTGNTFVGEYKAILDGTGWTTTDDTQGAFRVYDDPNDPNDPNDPIEYVTIRNLVIQNMPQWGILGPYQVAGRGHWTIEYNEIASTKRGLHFGPYSTIRNNYIHHNVGSNPSSSNPAERGGGYIGIRADNTILNNNEIAWNGPEQKVGLSVNVTFRDNFVHHNLGDGIWFDENNNAFAAPLAAVIQGNLVEDNGREGISFEISIGATIANNTIRRNGGDGVLISVSQNAQIYNNVLEANLGGIEYFLNCGGTPRGTISGTMRRTTTRSSSARRATRGRAASASSPSALQQSWRLIWMARRTSPSPATCTMCRHSLLLDTFSGAASGSFGMSGRHWGRIATAAYPSSC